jgi:hypothetical protein
MEKLIKYNYLHIAILSLSLIGADYGLINFSVSHHMTNTHCECSDISNNFEHLFSDCFEDDNFLSDSKIKSNKLANHIEIVSTLNDHFKDNYLNCIWQPPKFS